MASRRRAPRPVPRWSRRRRGAGRRSSRASGGALSGSGGGNEAAGETGQPGAPAAKKTPATTPTAKPKPKPKPKPTGPLQFGPVAPLGPDAAAIDFSDDREAFSLTFSDMEVVVNDGASRPDASRSFSLALPMTNAAKQGTVQFHVLGYVFTSEGANATVTMKVNDTETFKHWRSGGDDEYVQSLKLPAVPGATYHLQLDVEAHTHPQYEGDADGYLNITAVEAEITP